MQAETRRFRSNGVSPVDVLATNPVVRDGHSALADRAGFLQAMSSVANSVSVVTTDGREGKFGQTVTSFCSVSADPPQMLCCIRGASPVRTAIELNGCFTINVLSENQSSIADAFAGRSTEFPTYNFSHIPHGLTIMAARQSSAGPASSAVNLPIQSRADRTQSSSGT